MLVVRDDDVGCGLCWSKFVYFSVYQQEDEGDEVVGDVQFMEFGGQIEYVVVCVVGDVCFV